VYQFSRAIYRQLAPHIASARPCPSPQDDHAQVLRACEAAVERLVTDRHYFAHPARTLFNDIRWCFPVGSQRQVRDIVSLYMSYVAEFAANQPAQGCDANGNPLACRATTRKGTACQRTPLSHNGYCPSHQHLAATEDAEHLVAA
jgi:hypothetical protein